MSTPLSIGFILLPSFTMTPFAALLDVLRLAADDADGSRPRRLRWQIFAGSLDPVAASCGATVQPWGTFGEARALDYLVICGGLLSRDRRADDAVHTLLRDAAANGTVIVSLCTAVFDLAAAGLLDQRRACVSWFHADAFRERFDAVAVDASRLFVEDGPFITCSGGTGAADVGALIVQRHLGIGAARKALDILLIDQPRGPDHPQPAGSDFAVRDDLIRRAMLLSEGPESGPPSVARLASRLGVSRRTLERRFRLSTGQSPLAFLARARLRRADWLVRTTRLRLTTVAAQCGFADSAHLSRSFRREFGLSPSAARAEGGAYPSGEGRPYPAILTSDRPAIHSRD